MCLADISPEFRRSLSDVPGWLALEARSYAPVKHGVVLGDADVLWLEKQRAWYMRMQSSDRAKASLCHGCSAPHSVPVLSILLCRGSLSQMGKKLVIRNNGCSTYEVLGEQDRPPERFV